MPSLVLIDPYKFMNLNLPIFFSTFKPRDHMKNLKKNFMRPFYGKSLTASKSQYEETFYF